ncbi:type I restriction enzyme HsdR N-terminal domain-containing protein [Ancylobacter sp. WKF20]|uniref:type I restriction enzyme HsdR N-terminal domain-containing protein n=1 Tax=Ancylobacter sp. WKF20 TaxID=3039801 RepID=UPI0024341122|nr:type I restriction enzyme HsdR N-terminal domain-containing protein [Ancylobacter sp. WKF20]WGD31538.1 type I restriction enzyme HsdR N-terminal domain-containing protein [Ancylobacter sp. WKF20]
MAQTIDEFRTALLAFAERVQRVRGHIHNEEQTKVALVLPFISILGYDDRDPTEVAAEHAADFSDKYRNRVDYAVLKDLKPVIAVECKSVGNGRKDDRGQLKAYFNASRTVKLGVLTDGIVYEFFVDSQEPNMMDDEPFLLVDFDKVGKAQLTETLISGLYDFTKTRFDPDTISENARRSITYRAFFDYISEQFLAPSVEFTRFLLKEVDIKHVRLNAVEGYRAIAKSAFDDVFTSNVLKRLDITSTPPKAPARPEVEQVPMETSPVQAEQRATSENELRAFESVRRRLAYLAAGRDDLFDAIGKIAYRDYQGKMAVFYIQERKGRLLDILENRDGTIRFAIADGGEGGPVTDLALVDDRLRALFERRVSGQ